MSGIATDDDEVLESPPPPLIDRLSLLPNELLDSIFESVYSDDSPEAPLSKHLYPFFEEHLYRRVHLFSPRQVDLFLETITAHPDRGKLVKSLEFDREKGRVVKSIDILETLLPLLPNLLHLEIRAELIEFGHRSKNLFGSSKSVKSVSTEPGMDDEGFVNMEYFAFLASLPSLSNLTVYQWPHQSVAEEEEALNLPGVKTLRIEGVGADEDSIKVLADLCPALLSVDLGTTYDGDSISYEDALKVLPAAIHSLTLRSDYAFIYPEDHLLRRFTQLRSLDLDEGCYSKTIHIILSQLPLLVEVCLGQGVISPVDFLPLVSGPTRLVNLRQITLDFSAGRIGSRISYETYSTFTGTELMEGWQLPDVLGTGEEIEKGYVGSFKQLIKAAQANGVRIEGSVFEALEQHEDYLIENINRAVLAVYYKEDASMLQELRRARTQAFEADISLPYFDLDLHSIDFTHLELIETDLPERDWFIYSLRNGVGLSEEENELSEEEEFGTRTEHSWAKE